VDSSFEQIPGQAEGFSQIRVAFLIGKTPK
jgi:hypothetical protein